jgi:topoisomerase IV subunit A
VIDHHGRAYSVRVADLPGGRGDGTPISTLIDLQDGGKLAQVLTAPGETSFLVASSGGYGFIAQVADMVGRNKAGKGFLTLEKGESPLPPAQVSAGDTAITPTTAVATLSSAGRLLLFPLTELKVMAKGRGLTLMDLGKGDELVGAVVTSHQTLVVTGTGRGGKLASHTISTREQADYRGNRARRGQEIPHKIKPTGLSLL